MGAWESLSLIPFRSDPGYKVHFPSWCVPAMAILNGPAPFPALGLPPSPCPVFVGFVVVGLVWFSPHTSVFFRGYDSCFVLFLVKLEVWKSSLLFALFFLWKVSCPPSPRAYLFPWHQLFRCREFSGYGGLTLDITWASFTALISKIKGTSVGFCSSCSSCTIT